MAKKDLKLGTFWLWRNNFATHLTNVCFRWRYIRRFEWAQRKEKVMGNILPVTSNQGDAIRDMANEKGVGRTKWQRAHDDKRWSKFLDSLKEPVPPEGARIFILRATVKLDQPWPEAVAAAGPNTPDHHNVHKVSGLYVPTGSGREEREYVLLNHPNADGDWNKALAWANEEELAQTVPREAFAIGAEHPTLHNTLGMNHMRVVATTECTFGGGRQACCVWWNGARREARLFYVSYFVDAFGWFLFRKKSSVLDTKS